MRLHYAWLPLVLLGLGATSARGQATTVQLPTYSFFSTGTTVSVPDRGSVFMGGVKRAASGRNEFGTPLLPFRNRAFGTERSSVGTRVSVYIHDFEAMDEYLLSRPTSSAGLQRPVAGLQRRAVGLQAGDGDVWQQRLDAAQARSAGPAAMSVADLREKHSGEQRARQEEAVKWFQRGRNAEASGKANVARIYYQMAARRATGELKDQIAARLESVSGSPAAPKLAQSRP